MGRNVVLRCLPCPCFSSEDHNAPSSSHKINEDTDSSADSEDSPGRAEEVPPCKLVPLPRHERAYPRHAVGIDDQVNRVIQLLEWENETKVAVAVILHGLGGTGKTTLADAVVARLDIGGWNYSTVVPLESLTNFEDGEGEIQLDKQAFIYVDNDMVRGEHLRKLLPNESYNKNFRLLLTARDESVADVLSACGIHTCVYPVRPLPYQDARKLLCQKMGVPGRMQTPPQINEILEICDGVPLIVERVGAYICQSQDKDEAYKRVIEWSKEGKPFSSAEEYNIEKKGLLFDLDELPPSARETFLDICSFFNGWDWNQVSCMMGEDELNSLRKRALLLKKEECENKVMVRLIILTVSRNMTKGKRFTSAHELSKVLEGNELDDIGGIKGIWLEDNISEPLFISANKLDLMHDSLRVLALGDMAIVVDGQCTQKFKQIRYFQAGLIPCIPFHPKTSQELRILDWLPHNNNDLQLRKMSSKLKVLNLNGARYDRRFEIENVFERLRGLKTLKLTQFKTLKNLAEELRLLTQLEELDLSGCTIAQLPKGLGDLKALSKLSLRSCRKLRELPDSFEKLRSLKYLDLNYSGLKQLPKDFGSLSSLEELDLEHVDLKELPSSFGKLSSLRVLNIKHCSSLNHLPDDFGNLSALVRLEFAGTESLRSMPPSFQWMNCFPLSLSMPYCNYLADLPEEFWSYLNLVKDLSFESSKLLKNLPERLLELTSLRKLELNSCSKLESLPEGFGQLRSLVELSLKDCGSLQQLSTDFHCLASLQYLNMQYCEKLEGRWMDSVGKIKTLAMVNIAESPMLVKRWAEMEEEEESWHFAVIIGYQECKNAESLLNKAASKLFSGECLLTDSSGDPFSLSTVEPGAVLLVMFEHYKYSLQWEWKLLEEVVKHEHPLPFQMIYVGKYFDELSKTFADRIMAYASDDSDAFSLFLRVLDVTDYSVSRLLDFLVTKVVAGEEGRNQFSKWDCITYSLEDFLLSKSTLYSHLQKLIETPQESNVKLLRALFDTAESQTSSIFLRNQTENKGVDELHGKTVLLLISVMDEHPFHRLTDIYRKVKSNDDMEILSIPIPVDVRGAPQGRWEDEEVGLPDSDLAGFESILRNVPWPVLRNPWLLKTEVYYFLKREWDALNPAILVVVDPNGRICHKNALPLVKTWGAEIYPFTEEKVNQLDEQEPFEEQVGEYILNALL